MKVLYQLDQHVPILLCMEKLPNYICSNQFARMSAILNALALQAGRLVHMNFIGSGDTIALYPDAKRLYIADDGVLESRSYGEAPIE